MNSEKADKFVTVQDAIGMSDNVSVILIRSPFRALREAIENERWFEGITMSAVFLERFGAKKLTGYLQSKGIPMKPKRLARLGLATIGYLLLDFGIIDNSVHSKIVDL